MPASTTLHLTHHSELGSPLVVPDLSTLGLAVAVGAVLGLDRQVTSTVVVVVAMEDMDVTTTAEAVPNQTEKAKIRKSAILIWKTRPKR